MALQKWRKCYMGNNNNNNIILEVTETYADQINTPINVVPKTKMLIEKWQWRGGEGREDVLHFIKSQVKTNS